MDLAPFFTPVEQSSQQSLSLAIRGCLGSYGFKTQRMEIFVLVMCSRIDVFADLYPVEVELHFFPEQTMILTT